MMKDDNEDDLKNKEDLHRWKARGAGHIPLCGICFYRYNLKFYLPVYLWAVDFSRSNLHTFWELLNIIGDADSCNMFGIETEDGGNKVLF